MDLSGRTTLVPGSLPTENLPTKSIPSPSHNTIPCQSAENIQNKKAENPVVVLVLHQPPYSSFDDFNMKNICIKVKFLSHSVSSIVYKNIQI